MNELTSLTSLQRKAVGDALQLLRRANVEPRTLSRLAEQSFYDPTELSDLEEESRPSLAVQKASYTPLDATLFSEAQCATLCNRVTKRSFVSALVDHPEGAVVEYPEAAHEPGSAIAHQFKIDPSKFVHPRENIQFSLGDNHGGRNDVSCYLLKNSVTNKPISCKKRTYTCEYSSSMFISCSK